MDFDLGTAHDVSRETYEKLMAFGALTLEWNKKINLVAPGTEENIFQRHIADSAQLIDFFPADAKTYADIGSGGGFPGVVLAILFEQKDHAISCHLVESDQRKCAFLRTAKAKLGLSLKVHNKRIEDLSPLSADVLSARALAPLSKLLEFTELHLASGGTALFAKGENAQAEIEQAQEEWRFQLSRHPSKTHHAAELLVIKELERDRS